MIKESDLEKEKEESINLEKKEENNEEDIVFPITGIRFSILFAGLFLGYFMAALDTTILITMLGKIADEFGSIDQIGWVGSAYFLSISACQPLYIAMSDLVGQQITYSVFLIIFIAGSILCGASNSMMMLIISRAIQGIGGTGLLISALLITIHLMPAAERAKYQGILGTALGMATLLGPIIGGALADIDRWRWSFYLNILLGICSKFYYFCSMYILMMHQLTEDYAATQILNCRVPVVVIIATLCKLPPTEKQLERLRHEKTIWEQIREIDYATICILMPSCCIFLVGLQLGAEELMFTKPCVLVLLILGPILFIVFIFVEVFFVKSNPTFPRHFISSVHNIAILVSNFLTGAILNSLLYFTPLSFQIVRGDTAVQSAIKLFPLFIGMTVGGVVSGFAISITGYYKIFICFGYLIALISSALFQQTTIDTVLLILFVEHAIFGLGYGVFKNGLVVAGQASIPRKHLVIATSTGQFTRMIGGAFGVNIAAVIFNYNSQILLNQLKEKFHTTSSAASLRMIEYLPSSIKRDIRAAFLDSTNKTYILVVVATGVSFLVSFFIKNCRLETKKSRISKMAKKNTENTEA